MKAGNMDDRGLDGWMSSLTWWTWVLVSSGSWWWTGKPGILQSMESQRVRHDWETELTEYFRSSLVEFLKFSIWKIVAAKVGIFPSFTNGDVLFLIAMARTVLIILNNSNESAYPCLVHDPRVKAFSVSNLDVIFRFLLMSFNRFRNTFLLLVYEVFYLNRYWVSSNISASFVMAIFLIIIFILMKLRITLIIFWNLIGLLLSG